MGNNRALALSVPIFSGEILFLHGVFSHFSMKLGSRDLQFGSIGSQTPLVWSSFKLGSKRSFGAEHPHILANSRALARSFLTLWAGQQNGTKAQETDETRGKRHVP